MAVVGPLIKCLLDPKSAATIGKIMAVYNPWIGGSPAIKALKDYEKQRKAGVTDYTFDPDSLGIKNADFWKDKI